MSAVSLYYYFRIVLQMYLRDGEGAEPAPLVAAPWTERAIWVCALAVLVIGVCAAGPVLRGWPHGLQAPASCRVILRDLPVTVRSMEHLRVSRRR